MPATTFRATVAGIALLSMAGAALAQGGLDEAMAAYRSQDYVKAVQLLRPLAEKGDRTAQFRLGALYAEGKGVARDDKIALGWFEKSAEQGDAMAQYDAGASYAAGVGAPRDDVMAAKWFRRSADQGMAYAQLNLALLYASGRGVNQDNVEAMAWLQIALFGLPPGAARSDAARAMEDISSKMTDEQREDARDHARAWKAKPEKQF
jgi:TPR repeat protein